jgi:hypothetical protein
MRRGENEAGGLEREGRLGHCCYMGGRGPGGRLQRENPEALKNGRDEAELS